MDIDTKEIITLFGIIVSLVIGLTSIYIGIKNSKKTIFINSVTTSRSKWINTIRNTIAEFCGLATQVSVTIIEERMKKIDRVQQLRFLIKLQLNRNDQFDAKIIERVDLIANHIYDDNSYHVDKEIDKLINLTQDLLKLEWEGVKEETIKGNLSKREKSRLYHRYLKLHQYGEESV